MYLTWRKKCFLLKFLLGETVFQFTIHWIFKRTFPSALSHDMKRSKVSKSTGSSSRTNTLSSFLFKYWIEVFVSCFTRRKLGFWWKIYWLLSPFIVVTVCINRLPICWPDMTVEEPDIHIAVICLNIYRRLVLDQKERCIQELLSQPNLVQRDRESIPLQAILFTHVFSLLKVYFVCKICRKQRT